MKNFIINIIYKIISLIDYIDYHYIKKEKLIDNYKTTEEIILNDIEILSDTGYKPLYSITITKPFDIYSIELENGYKLDCADEHRFFGETFNEIYSKEKEKIPELKLPVWKYDNYFGYFNKDKKHGLGRFISTVSMKSLTGSYVNGEKQACFQLTSEDDMAKEKVVDDFFSYDLNSSEIEMNIINLATRKKTSVVSDTSFRKKEQLPFTAFGR